MTSQQFQDDIKELRPKLLRTAIKYLKNTEEAEDVVQDVMLKLWSMADGLQHPIDKLAYVMTKNLCTDHTRHHRPTGSLDQVAVEEVPEDERIEKVMRAINTLPPMQQTIFRLRHEEGMETRDIALLIGISEPAVRKTLSRARMAIRERLIKNNK